MGSLPQHHEAEELWRHPNPTSTPMWRFLQSVKERRGLAGEDYQSLYKWSVDNVGEFWEDCWDFVGIQAEVASGKVSFAPLHCPDMVADGGVMMLMMEGVYAYNVE